MRAFGVAAEVQHVLTDELVLVDGVAGLVLACGSTPEGGLLEALKDDAVPAIGVGDCLAPRTVEEAVLDGLVAGSGL